MNDSLIRAISLFATLVMLSGCARVTHRPVKYTPIPTNSAQAIVALEANKEADRKAKGIRYYQASPYLLVYSDGKGGIVWKIYYLPDQTLLMTAKPFNFISKVSATLTFSKGVLTESTEDADTTAVPKAILAAVEKLLPLALAADAPPAKRELLAPRLYKIIVSENEISLAGEEGDTPVIVTVKNK